MVFTDELFWEWCFLNKNFGNDWSATSGDTSWLKSRSLDCFYLHRSNYRLVLDQNPTDISICVQLALKSTCCYSWIIRKPQTATCCLFTFMSGLWNQSSRSYGYFVVSIENRQRTLSGLSSACLRKILSNGKWEVIFSSPRVGGSQIKFKWDLERERKKNRQKHIKYIYCVMVSQTLQIILSFFRCSLRFCELDGKIGLSSIQSYYTVK